MNRIDEMSLIMIATALQKLAACKFYEMDLVDNKAFKETIAKITEIEKGLQNEGDYL